MKRRTKLELTLKLCIDTWLMNCCMAVAVFLLSSCNESSANQSKEVKTTPQDSGLIKVESTQQANEGSGVRGPFDSDTTLQKLYSDILAGIKSRPGYTHFAEFMERGKFISVFMRPSNLLYTVLVPSDAAMKTLTQAKFSQLVYPEMVTQENLDFMYNYVGFGFSTEEGKSPVRTMVGKLLIYDYDKKKLTLDGHELKVEDELNLKPSTKLYFINKLVDGSETSQFKNEVKSN